jgi:hypothetical protein
MQRTGRSTLKRLSLPLVGAPPTLNLDPLNNVGEEVVNYRLAAVAWHLLP